MMPLASVSDTATLPGAGLETELATPSMGGTLRLLVASAPTERERVERDLRRVAGRVDAWARRLTRFSPTSDLSVLNADDGAPVVALRPTIAAVLSHGLAMSAATGGSVDVAMLEARLAAETHDRSSEVTRAPWSVIGRGHHHVLLRQGRTRFDLDGVAKGWIADRALRLLDGYPSALVDADGDVAVRASGSAGWSIAVGHPLDERVELARLRAPERWPSARFGVATSGTSVHRWHGPAGPTHHLIDPGTGRPAVTDVVQATVVAETAGLAESLAKSAVIRGSRDGLELLDRAGAWAALLLRADDELLLTSGSSGWLA